MKRKSGAPSSTSPCKGEVGRVAAGRGSLAPRFSRTLSMTSRARRLRNEITKAERKLWNTLRRDQLEGFHFRRQHPVGPYVVDFYCPSIRLALEVDGGQHNYDKRQNRDRRRTRWLESRGITVLRFWNNDITENLEGVWSEIARVAVSLRSNNVTPSLPLPLSGGGKEYVAPDSQDH